MNDTDGTSFDGVNVVNHNVDTVPEFFPTYVKAFDENGIVKFAKIDISEKPSYGVQLYSAILSCGYGNNLENTNQNQEPENEQNGERNCYERKLNDNEQIDEFQHKVYYAKVTISNRVFTSNNLKSRKQCKNDKHTFSRLWYATVKTPEQQEEFLNPVQDLKDGSEDNLNLPSNQLFAKIELSDISLFDEANCFSKKQENSLLESFGLKRDLDAYNIPYQEVWYATINNIPPIKPKIIFKIDSDGTYREVEIENSKKQLYATVILNDRGFLIPVVDNPNLTEMPRSNKNNVVHNNNINLSNDTWWISLKK